MAKMIFVNLPVADVAAATAFYAAIGMTKDARFSNDVASAMVWSDTISFLLLDHAYFSTFTAKRIVDAHDSSEVLLCLSQESRDAVDAITDAALAAGGTEPRAVQDHGFMYGRTFTDLDGHIFEPMFMDMEAAMAAMGQARPD
ncbi:lactoylglutathione lyase [Sphingomonas ginsenosidivorax]|uniref:Lactoylglutathione lyase n=1 Tax=Sphingomonas ginsenosidivorax TaxID=862135 RepID=A0A5C6UAR9_9SPHN|nr:lactoylglutathione lyase [Sphingomonas ginsenosidivorax]TXC69862.1 lactoylglutathione lyase [Sphingomonas ginsenosidivorax]